MSEQADIAERLDRAVEAARDRCGADPLVLPRVCCVAARDCLAVAGAALSVHEGADRVPLAASDELAARAERLQFTLDSGPALDASADGRTVAAGARALPSRWSPWAAELFRVTPFRSVVSVLVSVLAGWQVTLDLYLHEDDPEALALAEVAAVADRVAAELLAHADPVTAESWLSAGGATLRHDVWLVLGRIAGPEWDFEEALAVLRARAFALGTDVDDVAAQVLSGRLDLDELRPPGR